MALPDKIASMFCHTIVNRHVFWGDGKLDINFSLLIISRWPSCANPGYPMILTKLISQLDLSSKWLHAHTGKTRHGQFWPRTIMATDDISGKKYPFSASCSLHLGNILLLFILLYYPPFSSSHKSIFEDLSEAIFCCVFHQRKKHWF